MARTRLPALVAGDVIRTNPSPGYWGCALVLRTGVLLDGLLPQCHIAITPLVHRHPYEFAELQGLRLSVLVFDRGIRIAVHSYVSRRETCIGLYLDKPHPTLPVIGRIDPKEVWPDPLTDEVGDGTDHGWPLYGPVPAHLGSAAVAAWRAVHDSEAWAALRAESEAAFERLEAERLREARERRAKRRNRGA